MVSRLSLVSKGFLMGIADVVPGVSGGTMALITGIYGRLVLAIRHVDLTLVGGLLQRRFWSSLARALVGRGGAPPLLDPVVARAESVAFLITLVLGIGAAVLTGARFIPGLLDAHPELMRALFFGLVLASVAVPWRRMRSRGPALVALALATAVGTYWMMGAPVDDSGFSQGHVQFELRDGAGPVVVPPGTRLQGGGVAGKHDVRFSTVERISLLEPGVAVTVPVVATRAGVDANLPAGVVDRFAHPLPRGGEALSEAVIVKQAGPIEGGRDPSLLSIGVAAAIAICAMILPGISGAFLLLIMGKYGFVLYQLHLALSERSPTALTVVAVFLAGIAIGLLAFSRVLHWLLARAHDWTMAALVGLMIGSLRKLWPFQLTTPAGAVNTTPAVIGADWVLPLLAFALGVAAVLLLERIGATRRDPGLA